MPKSHSRRSSVFYAFLVDVDANLFYGLPCGVGEGEKLPSSSVFSCDCEMLITIAIMIPHTMAKSDNFFASSDARYDP